MMHQPTLAERPDLIVIMALADVSETTLNAVTELLTTEELTNLGVEVAVNQTSYEDAARQWLEDNGLS
jgi:glycine betaine/choline ABC-type transport system substrate-binding protein